jgi:hypothetical protein
MPYNVNNKKRNDMKNDILEIIQQHKLGHIPDEQALNELCVLFSVVWRSEPFSLTCTNGYDGREHYCECKNECLKCMK